MISEKELEFWKAIIAGLCANPAYMTNSQESKSSIEAASLLQDAQAIMLAMGFGNTPSQIPGFIQAGFNSSSG